MPTPAYLLGRGLSPATLGDKRFLGTYRVTAGGAVMFAHYDNVGATGYELRGLQPDGSKLKAFMRDGKHALWRTNNLAEARTIVLTESGIDCLSHHQLHGGDVLYRNAGYMSCAGQLSVKQVSLIVDIFQSAIKQNAHVVIATDNDDAGHGFHQRIINCMDANLQPLIDRNFPIGVDWNDDLKFKNCELS